MNEDQRNSQSSNIDGDIDFGENKFLKWLDNYWYHYKWRTIIAGFFILTFLFVFIQCQTDPKKDMVVAYCGPTGFAQAETETVRAALQEVMPADFDGNGTKYVEFVRYTHYSPDELEQNARENNGEGTINLSYNGKQLQDFYSFVQMGVSTADCSVYLLSPYVYDEIPSRPFVKLADVWESGAPATAYDAYAIRVSETAWYRTNEELQKVIPADTLLCLVTVTNKNSLQFKYSLEMFRAMAK